MRRSAWVLSSIIKGWAVAGKTARKSLAAGVSGRLGPFTADQVEPVAGNQLMTGRERVYSVPDPVFWVGFLAGLVKDILGGEVSSPKIPGQTANHLS